MPTVRALDPVTGDIVTSGIQFIDGRNAVAQTVKTRLNLILGEYFRDITEGVDWFGVILGKGASLSQREALLRTKIVQTEGVQQLTEFEATFEPITRNYSVTASILTEDGLVDLNESLGV